MTKTVFRIAPCEDARENRFAFTRLILSVRLEHGTSNDSIFIERVDRRKPVGCTMATVKLMTDGGADRDRTDDLRLAKPALSQLSYSPD